MHLTEVPAQAIELITKYLSTVYGAGQDFGEHLGCYAADALVLVGPRVFRREQMPLDLYIATMSESHAILDLFGAKRDGLRVPTLEMLAADEVKVENDVAAVKATIQDKASGQKFDAVFVFNDDGLLGATILEDGILPEPYKAQAMVAAEFAQVPPLGGPNDLYLTGLELSFARIFISDQDRLRYLPESRFTCQNCGESCRIGSVYLRVPDAVRMAVESIPWAHLAPGKFEDRELFKTLETPDPTPLNYDQSLESGEDGFCVFWDRQVGCNIHAVVGRQPIPACHKFPYMFTRTPDGVDVWTSFHCHAALHGLGTPFADQERTIHSALWANRYHVYRVKDEVFLKSPSQPLTWEAYKAMETALLDLLDPADPSPLEPRLQLGENIVKQLEKHFHDKFTPEDVAAIVAEAKAKPIAPRERKGFEDDLAVEYFCLLLSYRLSPDEAQEFLAGGFGALYAGLINQPQEWEPPVPLVAQFLRHTLFHKMFLQSSGVFYTWRYMLLTYAAMRLYVRYLNLLETRQPERVLATVGTIGRSGAEGSLMVVELPLLPPTVQSGPHGEHPQLAHLQQAIQSLDLLVVHFPQIFSTAFIERDLQRERLLGPTVGSALIWG